VCFAHFSISAFYANAVLHRRSKGMAAAQASLFLSGSKAGVCDTRKGMKNPTMRRRRGRKRKVVKLDIAKSTAIIEGLITNDLDIHNIVLLLGECLLYESVFIWQREALERYKTVPPSGPFLLGEMLPIIQYNHMALLELMLELPRMKSLKNYNLAVESDYVTHKAFIRAKSVVLHLVTTRKFECKDEITDYVEKKFETRYVPKANIVEPIASTFCKCHRIVSVEGNSH
jgi:hypothetical protein